MQSTLPNTFSRSLNISLFLAETYQLPAPLQIVIWWICIYQIDMQSWLDMKIFFIKLQVVVAWMCINYGDIVHIC